MKKKVFKPLRKEDGISLIEVLASIVLLSIILLSFYYTFIQSAKTTKTSEEIIEATYFAQIEMEKLYSFSKGKSLPTDFETELFPDYGIGVRSTSRINEFTYENKVHTDVYIILLVEDIGSNLTRVLIKVFDEKGGNLKATMQTTVEWGP